MFTRSGAGQTSREDEQYRIRLIKGLEQGAFLCLCSSEAGEATPLFNPKAGLGRCCYSLSGIWGKWGWTGLRTIIPIILWILAARKSIMLLAVSKQLSNFALLPGRDGE